MSHVLCKHQFSGGKFVAANHVPPSLNVIAKSGVTCLLRHILRYACVLVKKASMYCLRINYI